MTYQDIKNNDEINTYIRQADQSLSALGYTEHSFAHVTLVAEKAGYILSTLGYPDRTVELAKIAGIDIESFALSMFEAGSDFGEKSIEDIFYSDFKTFVSGDNKFGVAQVSAVTDNQLTDVKSKIYPAMKQCAIDKNLNMVFVMLTNILEERSELIHVGNVNVENVKLCFPGSVMDGDSLVLDKVVSRKKQLIPGLMEAFLM